MSYVHTDMYNQDSFIPKYYGWVSVGFSVIVNDFEVIVYCNHGRHRIYETSWSNSV